MWKWRQHRSEIDGGGFDVISSTRRRALLVGGGGKMDGLMKVASANQIHHENLQTAFYDISTEIRNESMRRRMRGVEKSGWTAQPAARVRRKRRSRRKHIRSNWIASKVCLWINKICSMFVSRSRGEGGERRKFAEHSRCLVSVFGNHHENPEKHLLRDVSGARRRRKSSLRKLLGLVSYGEKRKVWLGRVLFIFTGRKRAPSSANNSGKLVASSPVGPELFIEIAQKVDQTWKMKWKVCGKFELIWWSFPVEQLRVRFPLMSHYVIFVKSSFNCVVE